MRYRMERMTARMHAYDILYAFEVKFLEYNFSEYGFFRTTTLDDAPLRTISVLF